MHSAARNSSLGRREPRRRQRRRRWGVCEASVAPVKERRTALSRRLVFVLVLVLVVPSHSLKSPCIHSLALSLSLSSSLPASFQRLFISPTPISLPGKYLQELATIDDYLVNSLLCGEGSQDFPRVCLPYLYLSGRGGREEPKIPCLFLIRPLHSNFVYRWPPWILGAQSFVKRTVKKLNVCNCISLFFLISV